MQKFALRLVFLALSSSAFGQFHPPAGQNGSSAMFKDSSAFKGWASKCTVVRGYKDISTPDSGYASVGDVSSPVGKADGMILSLGDGGEAILTFEQAIANGPSWDFAVFENSFADDFLELAFVEVSSDGQNFVRFKATSNTQNVVQTDGFGSTDATKLNNLAGKYRGQYGTPFDLEELKNEAGLDISRITHVKVIDVVGNIDPRYARYDHLGQKINDPWPTPFPSCGFDLDAVGVIHSSVAGLPQASLALQNISPNPFREELIIKLLAKAQVDIYTISGVKIYSTFATSNLYINTENWPAGIYFASLQREESSSSYKLIKY